MKSESFPKLLRRLRLSRNIASHKDAAKIVGVWQQSWSRWENGQTTPSASDLFRICRAFGVTCDYFADCFQGDNDPPTPKPKGRPRKPPPDAKSRRK